jgi:hypothetical protein
MTLGTGIFLSSLLISPVFLFWITKDRWNWKKIVVWFTLASIGLCLFIAAGLWINNKFKSRILPPKPQSQLGLLKLSHTKSDVKFLMGAPDTIKEDVWFYKNTDHSKIMWVVWFKGEQIWLVENIGFELFTLEFGEEAVNIKGFWIGQTKYNDIFKFYGKPSSISYSSDQLERMLTYEKYNVFARFRENNLIAYGIYNPELGTPKFRDENEK